MLFSHGRTVDQIKPVFFETIPHLYRSHQRYRSYLRRPTHLGHRLNLSGANAAGREPWARRFLNGSVRSIAIGFMDRL